MITQSDTGTSATLYKWIDELDEHGQSEALSPPSQAWSISSNIHEGTLLESIPELEHASVTLLEASAGTLTNDPTSPIYLSPGSRVQFSITGLSGDHVSLWISPSASTELMEYAHSTQHVQLSDRQYDSASTIPLISDTQPLFGNLVPRGLSERFRRFVGNLSSFAEVGVKSDIGRYFKQPIRRFIPIGLVKPEARERLDYLRQLEEDWDGFGANKIKETAVLIASALLVQANALSRGIFDQPFIAPLPNGGIQLEWETDRGSELIIEISPDGDHIEYWSNTSDENGQWIESEGVFLRDADFSELLARLAN